MGANKGLHLTAAGKHKIIAFFPPNPGFEGPDKIPGKHPHPAQGRAVTVEAMDLVGQNQTVNVQLLVDQQLGSVDFPSLANQTVLAGLNPGILIRIGTGVLVTGVALRQTEFYGLCGGLRILRRGRTVIFLMTSDPDRAERYARRYIS